MKLVFALFAVIAITSALDWETEMLKEDPLTLELFNNFMNKYEKSYGSLETLLEKLQVFKQNLKVAEALNVMDPGATYGVTQFSDLSQDEFAEQYLTLNTEGLKSLKETAEEFDMSEINVEDAPTSYDWREHGAVTPVKNQGQCGSCWAFSTIANLEGQYFKKTGNLTSFSEQELVDCDKKSDQGCNGGLMQNAFEFLKTTGFELESDYKYTARDGTCKSKDYTEQGKVASWKMLDQEETAMGAALAVTGPLSAAVNAAHFQMYTGGISDPFMCNKKALDHGITLVGFGTGKNWLGQEVDFWTIKNSWGPSWGEKGYIRLVKGKGACGINTNVCTSTLV